MLRLGVDVGGTFTDLVVDDGSSLRAAKVASTRTDESAGVMQGVERLGVDVSALDRFAHGTTVATNTVLERDGARTVLVVTAGFRDVLEIGRQNRPHLYDFTVQRPTPLVPRDLVVEARERMTYDGEVLTALAEPGDVVDAVADLAPDAVAVCLLHAYRDDRHERVLAEALEELGVAVSRSSDVLPVFREYERASTTVLNAYVAPRLARYLGTLEQRLGEDGLACPIEVMRSSGGTFTASAASRRPVHTLLSGPAAGAWGAAAVARSAGLPDVIAFDMGGTSTDVTLIDDGRPATTSEGAIDGLPFAVRTTDVHTVGAGGGSIAWCDAGGSLRVGPRSAGADPGPAAYGRGGTDATVTDAHVVLGRLGAQTALGGTLALDDAAARDAVARLAAQIDLDVEDCAEGIVRVAEANIARALRVVSVERGHDPRDYGLLAFGGAGPLHQGALARELGCPVVVVPPHAGVLAALGLLATPRTAEAVRTHIIGLQDLTGSGARDVWRDLADEARRVLTEQGTSVRRLQRSVDCRYEGQAYELEVPVESDEPDPAELARRFHDAHDERYGYAQRDERVQLVNLRVRAEGPDPDAPLRAVGSGSGDSVVGERPVRIDGTWQPVQVHARDRLGDGDEIAGAAIVADMDTTLLLLPGQRARVDRHGSLLISDGR